MNRQLCVSLILVVFLLLLAACAAAPAAVPGPTDTVAPVLPTPTLIPPTLIPPTPVPPTLIPPTDVAALNPSPRGYVSMAYDVESDQIILFGGTTGNIFLAGYTDPDDTWAYDVAANKWTQMKPPSGPTGRAAAALAYDAESDRVILFGGSEIDAWDLDDTWAYDYNTNTWTEMAKGPANHLGPRIAYDAESDRIILFGGYNLSGYYYNDTWAYDFNSDTWTEMKPSTSPPGRNYQAIAYDAESDRVLTWGGMGLDEKLLAPNVWSYDFNQNMWQEMEIGEGLHPQGADYAAMVYDAKADRTILFGGVSQEDETWAYDYNTNTWVKLEPSTVPGKLSRHAMAYSTAADRVILFGGQVGSTQFTYTDETWTYDLKANTWTNATPHP